MLAPRVLIFLSSRQREAGYAESSLAPETKIRKVTKSWCTQVITNRAEEMRGIQLQGAPDSCCLLVPCLRASWEVGLGSTSVKMVDAQLAENPITSSGECKCYHIIFQPLTSLQWLLTAVGQKTKIYERFYQVLHNLDVACLSHESHPHFPGDSTAPTI